MEILYGVNEIGVLGTACFMLALSMLWYSPHAFLSVWEKEVYPQGTPPEISRVTSWLHAGIVFICYVVSVLLLAVMIGYAALFGYSVVSVTTGVLIGYMTLSLGLSLRERRSVRYYGVTLGFSAVFIVGSAFLLSYWPW